MEGKRKIPVIAFKNFIPFPKLQLEIEFGNNSNKEAVAYARENALPVVLVSEPNPGVFDSIGVLAILDAKIDNKVYLTERFNIDNYEKEGKIIFANGKIRESKIPSEKLQQNFENFVNRINFYLEDNYDSKKEDPEVLVSFISYSQLDFSRDERIALLEEDGLEDRMSLILGLIEKRNQEARRKKIEQIKSKQEGSTVEDQQGEKSPSEHFLEKIKKSKMPLDAKKVATEEFKRLESLHPSSSEYGVIKNYLSWLISLPWQKMTKDNIDLKDAKKTLDNDHFGMDKVKNRILEFLAITKLKNNMKGPIICLVGPPGVGKTSLCKSIASSLGRQYHRISLGGVRDEAEIRGHRKTYVGAMPGRIIKGIKKVESRNPVIVLDEIDKLGRSNQGDPTAAMLEVLDPEQNHSFNDNYLEIPFDLSNVLFIATANYVQNIPEPLRDRMELIYLSGYTHEEKFHIAKSHLVEKSKTDNGLKQAQLSITDDALNKIIQSYTKESGVRNLKRKIDAVSRYAAKEIVEFNKDQIIVDLKNVQDILGKEMSKATVLKAKEPGVVNGLAWTPYGGEVLNIEASFYPGAGKRLTLSGSLKEVMRESGNLAMILIKSKMEEWKLDPKVLDKSIHVHVPAGGQPKDGPSAGVTFVVTMMSLLKNISVSSEIAMTGEISLKGSVLPVGGIKEKILGAYKEGIKKVYIPKANEKDLEDVPQEILKEIDVKKVENVNDILAELNLLE